MLPDEPRIDCHAHIFDPARFPYGADTFYRPLGHEIAPAAQLNNVMRVYGVSHALLVGPNSGYGFDNGCMLDAIALGERRFKGIAVVPNDIDHAALVSLKAQGVVGVAFNATHHGVAYYAQASSLLARLKALDLYVDVQVEADQMAELAPLLAHSGARILIDHCGRPVPEAGLPQAGFRAVLDLAATGRAFVKLSGYSKFSRDAHPFKDVHPYVHALLEAFTADGCMWSSDWPFLRAPARADYGPLLELIGLLIPDPVARRRVLWDTPRRLFAFDG